MDDFLKLVGVVALIFGGLFSIFTIFDTVDDIKNNKREIEVLKERVDSLCSDLARFHITSEVE